MTDTTTKAVPAKCQKCSQPMSTPLACDFCHALYADALGTDYFTLLGLPRQFAIDPAELQRQYVALSRHAHPDMAVSDSPEVQQLHLRMAASVNNAYRTLKDPIDRAAYLLGLLGGKSSAEDKSVPDGFLGTMMMMQEELSDAKAGNDQAESRRIGAVLQTQHDGLLKRVETLFQEYQESLACEAVRKDLLDELRKQLNAASYVRKLLTQTE